MKKQDNFNYTLLPPSPRSVHLMGICGTGMAALAGMFHEIGCRVTGSDHAVYPPMSDFLKDLGIEVKQGYSPANLRHRPDLVVVGNVIRRENPEAAAVRESSIPYTSLPGALSRYFISDKTRIVVAGTHGKTTVSSMIAWILFKKGLDPGFMIGGIPGNFNRNYRLGSGTFFVLEGDEYDTAYFDKRPKFLHYLPHVAVVTSCEFDHVDIYQSLEEIQRQFGFFVGLVPTDGTLIAFAEDPGIRQVLEHCACRVETYGLRAEVDWSLVKRSEFERGVKTSVFHKGRKTASGTLPVLGYHNLLNAVAAIATAHRVGVPPQEAMEALGSFKGVKRRQEILGDVAGILLMDDFAHHPTAVRVTCSGVRSRYPTRRLIAVFEPRTNTNRRAVFQGQYVSAFLDADVIALREPRDVETIPQEGRFSSRKLAEDLRLHGKRAHAFADTDGIIEFLQGDLRRNDVVLVMSNGSFDNINVRLLDILKEREHERSLAV
jgi:UDP-N-acetylmuramate: L-alanyl-gamma-D-glutamyl-meso-diaminopimelate ligase